MVRVWCGVLIGQRVCTVRCVLMSEPQKSSTRHAKYGRLSDMGRLVQACDSRMMVGWRVGVRVSGVGSRVVDVVSAAGVDDIAAGT